MTASLIAHAADWGLALVPVLILLGVFVWLDAFKLMSLGEVLVLLLLGGVGALAAYPVSGRLLDALPIGFSSYSRFVAPWIEEAIKGFIVILLFRANRIGYKLDAVISGFAVGAGFSLIENILYLTLYPQFGPGTWLVRGLGTAVMHGTTLAVLAATAHEFAERETRDAAGDFNFNLLWFVPGYLAAVALHTAFNQFPDQPLLAMLGAAVASPILMLIIFQFGTAEAQSWLEKEAREHQAQIDALASGGWPGGSAGDKIRALAERSGGDQPERIRRYWQVQAWLVLEAERSMANAAAGDSQMDGTAVAAAFAELAQLQRSMGASVFAALKPLLPFSRNDYWELSELRQRIGR